MTRVSLLSYGIGNLRSVTRALEHVGAEVEHATTAEDVATAEHLVLPGVGAFSHCAQQLRERGLWLPIADHLRSDGPFLGICVGMQLMLDASEEFGLHDGFGLIAGRVQRLPEQSGQKVPMVGWKMVENRSGNDIIGEANSFYFVHSFSAEPEDLSQQIATYRYGETEITAAVSSGNKLGTQFHPEKSGETGLALLERFVKS